jgi:NADH-ubiquinone oxidoreductase chain 3
MTSTTFFFVFIPLLAIVLLAVNLIFAPHNPYQEKDSAFECGFHSFLGQNRTQFSISFFIYGLLFLLFDLEILLVFPFAISAYTNGIYGLIIMLVFFFALTLGFVFELGKNALKIDSRQMLTLNSKKVSITGSISIFVRSRLNFLPNKNCIIKSSRPVTKTGILGSGH